MGKKYSRMMASGSGVGVDPRWQFEVATGKIITYKSEPRKGLLNSLRRKFDWVASAEYPITSKTTVEISCPTSGGSAYCDVRTNGNNFRSFHIYGEAKGFTEEVQREINNATHNDNI